MDAELTEDALFEAMRSAMNAGAEGELENDIDHDDDDDCLNRRDESSSQEASSTTSASICSAYGTREQRGARGSAVPSIGVLLSESTVEKHLQSFSARCRRIDEEAEGPGLVVGPRLPSIYGGSDRIGLESGDERPDRIIWATHECSETCFIQAVRVVRYASGHLCVEDLGVYPPYVCEDPNDERIHESERIDASDDYYVCLQSGRVHRCDEACQTIKRQNRESHLVCPVSGRVFGDVEYRAEWWADPEKQRETVRDIPDNAPAPQRRQIVYPRIVAKRTGTNGPVTEQYLIVSAKLTTHPHYQVSPFEKSYDFYLERAMRILWHLLFSPDREDRDNDQRRNAMETMKRNIAKQERRCTEPRAQPFSFLQLCTITRQGTKKLGRRCWQPDPKKMHLLLLYYGAMFVNFYVRLLEMSDANGGALFRASFDYVICTALHYACIRGISTQKGQTLVPPDPYLLHQAPSQAVASLLGVQQSALTKTRRTIVETVGLYQGEVPAPDVDLTRDTQHYEMLQRRLRHKHTASTKTRNNGKGSANTTPANQESPGKRKGSPSDESRGKQSAIKSRRTTTTAAAAGGSSSSSTTTQESICHFFHELVKVK